MKTSNRFLTSHKLRGGEGARLVLRLNDLPNCLSNPVARMYADDTHLTFASNNIETINGVMNHDLSNVNT